MSGLRSYVGVPLAERVHQGEVLMQTANTKSGQKPMTTQERIEAILERKDQWHPFVTIAGYNDHMLVEEKLTALIAEQINAAVVKEREACAAIAENHGSVKEGCDGGTDCWRYIAEAIRART